MITKELSNGVKMPMLIQGIPLAGASEGMSIKRFHEIVRSSIEIGIHGFDTSAAYGPSEEAIGKLMPSIDRSSIFITTKISNQQQQAGNICQCIERALRLMKTDYIDCMLLHWPYPGYTDNWKKRKMAYEEYCHNFIILQIYDDGTLEDESKLKKYFKDSVVYKNEWISCTEENLKFFKDNNTIEKLRESLKFIVPIVYEKRKVKVDKYLLQFILNTFHSEIKDLV